MEPTTIRDSRKPDDKYEPLLARLAINSERKILLAIFVQLNTLRLAASRGSVPGLLSLIGPILARTGTNCRRQTRSTEPLLRQPNCQSVTSSVEEIAYLMRSVEALEHIPDNDVLEGRDQSPLTPQKNTYRLRVVGIFAFDALLRGVCRSLVGNLPKSNISRSLKDKLVAMATQLRSDPDKGVQVIATNVLRVLETEVRDE